MYVRTVFTTSISPQIRRGCAALLLGVLGLATSPAPADAAEWTVDLHAGGQHSYDPSFDAFGRGDTPNVYTAATVGLGYGFDESVGVDGLTGYAAFGRATTGGPRFDDAYNFEWSRHLYLVGAEYVYPLTPGIRPFVRATVGVSHQRVALTSPGDSTYTQARVQFATRDAVGLELRTPYAAGDEDDNPKPFALGEGLSLGATAQVGYLWQPSVEFDDVRASSDDPWNRSGINLGELRTSGWFWSFGATIRLRF